MPHVYWLLLAMSAARPAKLLTCTGADIPAGQCGAAVVHRSLRRQRLQRHSRAHDQALQPAAGRDLRVRMSREGGAFGALLLRAFYSHRTICSLLHMFRVSER